jgi:hypothetical protein
MPTNNNQLPDPAKPVNTAAIDGVFALGLNAEQTRRLQLQVEQSCIAEMTDEEKRARGWVKIASISHEANTSLGHGRDAWTPIMMFKD